MFDRFTERARWVLTLTRQEAQRLGHDYIGLAAAFALCRTTQDRLQRELPGAS